jgi:hypothetical protein
MYTASCSNLLAQKFSWIATLLVFMAPELHCLVSKGSETLKPNIAHYWFLKNPDIISSKGNSTLVGFRSSPASRREERQERPQSRQGVAEEIPGMHPQVQEYLGEAGEIDGK